MIWEQMHLLVTSQVRDVTCSVSLTKSGHLRFVASEIDFKKKKIGGGAREPIWIC